MYIPLWWQIICKLQVCEHSSVDHIKQYTYDTHMWQSYQQCQKIESVSGTDHQWHTESLSVPGAHARSSSHPFCLLQPIHFLSSTLCFQSEPCMVWKQQHRLNYSLKRKKKKYCIKYEIITGGKKMIQNRFIKFWKWVYHTIIVLHEMCIYENLFSFKK